MKITKGKWKVVRNCCTLGNCVLCNGKTPVGIPMRIVQMDNISEKSAKLVAENWRDYEAKAERM